MPQALALTWELLKDEKVAPDKKYQILLDFDKVFGLRLDEIKEIKIPLKVKGLADKREKFRQAKNFQKADEIRKQVEALGFEIEDTEKGPKLSPK